MMNGFADAFLESHGGFDWLRERQRLASGRVKLPSETLLFGEKQRTNNAIIGDIVPQTAAFLSLLDEARHGGNGTGATRDDGRSNYAYADGHVASLGFGKSTCPENLWGVTSRWRTR